MKLILYLIIQSLLFAILFYRKKIDFYLIKKGQRLRKEITTIIQSNGQVKDFSVTTYKFYSNVVILLLKSQRTFGLSIELPLRFIRDELVLDLNFENKLISELKVSLFQFFLISFLTWCLIYFSSILLECSLNSSHLILILIIQICGFIIFFSGSFLKRNHTFKNYLELYSIIFHFLTFSEVGYPISKTITESNLFKLNRLKFKRFSEWLQNLESNVKKWQNQGVSINDELKILIKELAFLQEEDFCAFGRFLNAYKLLIIILFFLSTYFFSLYSLFSTFVVL